MQVRDRMEATQAGVALPVPRFTTDYYGLTAVDNLTGLMWTLDSRTPDPYDPNAQVCAPVGASDALAGSTHYIPVLTQTIFLGHNDWRLPNRWEFRSLIVDHSTFGPAIPSDYPFINVEDGWHYWSSTTCAPVSFQTHTLAMIAQEHGL